MTHYKRIPDVYKTFKDLCQNDSIHETWLFDLVNDIKWTVEYCYGYLAGGFPRFVLSYVRNQTDKDRSSNFSLENYFSGGGDLDFFFPTKQHFDAALGLVKVRFQDKDLKITESPLGNATTIKYLDKVKTQFIKRSFMSYERMLDDFDMINSMVSIDGDDVVVHPRWEELEDQKCLDMERSNGFFWLGRIRKYIVRHGYKKISSRTLEFMCQKISDSFWKLSENPITMSIKGRNNKPLTLIYGPANLLLDAEKVLSVLPMEELEKFKAEFGLMNNISLYEQIVHNKNRQKVIQSLFEEGIDPYDYNEVTQNECPYNIPDKKEDARIWVPGMKKIEPSAVPF
jgi:hypothetical protein